MSSYDLKKMENEIALGMMLRYRIREPTLWQVQRQTDKFNLEKQSMIPAWLRNSEASPGLPEHYITVNAIENDFKSSADDDGLQLPDLPFEVNRVILYKLLIVPTEWQHFAQSQPFPALNDLMNGTILVIGPPLPIAENIKKNIEIFLNLHDKLLPCCYAQQTEIITSSPMTPSGRVRCYYIPELSRLPEITFLSSKEKILKRSQFLTKWLHGSIPYHSISNHI